MKYDYTQTVNLKHNEYLQKVNVDTGEQVDLLYKQPTKKEIHYDRYSMLNLDVMDYLCASGRINHNEKGYLLDLCRMVNGHYNALVISASKPHTLETLSEALGLSYPRTTLLVKKLIEMEVMGKLKVGKKNHLLLNPYLTRNKREISFDTIGIFPDFTIQMEDYKINATVNKMVKTGKKV